MNTKLSADEFRTLCSQLRYAITSVRCACDEHEQAREAAHLIPLVTELRRAELKRPKASADLLPVREKLIDEAMLLHARYGGAS